MELARARSLSQIGEVPVVQRCLEGGIWQVGGKKELSYGQLVLDAKICESRALWEFVRLLEGMDF